MSSNLHINYVVEPDQAALAWRAATHLVELAEEAAAARGRVRIAISGGNTPKASFALLANPDHPFLQRMPWAELELFFVDERTVPPDNANSNYRMTRETLLDHVNLRPEQIHRIHGELEPEVAAAEYEYDLRRTFRLEGAEAPRFDVIALGMGDDGTPPPSSPHRGRSRDGPLGRRQPGPPKRYWRVTLTWPVINHAREVFFLIEGAAKAPSSKKSLPAPSTSSASPPNSSGPQAVYSL